MNRYTQITPSQFSPLSMQEIFTVPLARQKQHDEAQAKLDELGLFDIQRLSEDDPAVREYVDQYKGKIDSEIENILSQGVNNRTSRQIRSLVSERNKWMSQDQPGGQMAANYANFNAYKKQLDKQFEDKQIDLNTYNAGLMQARAGYTEGVAGGGKLDLQTLANKVDISEYLRPYAKDIQDNPVLVEQYSGLKPIGNGMMLDEKTGREYTPEGAIKFALNNIAKTDPSIQSYLSQQQQLGLIPNVDKYLDTITGTFDATYSVDKTTKDRIYRNIPGYDPSSANIPVNTFELENTPIQYKLYNDDFSNTLGKMLDDELQGEELMIDYEKGFDPFTQSYFKKKSTESGKPYKLEVHQQAEYDKIFKGLVKSGHPSVEGISHIPNSKEAMNAVKNYIDTHNNIDYSNKIETSGLVKTYEGKYSKNTTYNPEQIAEGIALQADNRIWIKEGNVINFKNLPKDIIDQINNQEFKVSGVYSPENYFSENIKDPLAKDAVASGYQVKFKDGTKYMVSRSTSERNTPAYKSMVMYNDVWGEINSRPDIPYEKNIKGIDYIFNYQENDKYDKNGNLISRAGYYIQSSKNASKLNIKPQRFDTAEAIQFFIEDQ